MADLKLQDPPPPPPPAPPLGLVEQLDMSRPVSKVLVTTTAWTEVGIGVGYCVGFVRMG